MAVEAGRQPPHEGQVDDRSHLAQEVIGRDTLLQVEVVDPFGWNVLLPIIACCSVLPTPASRS